MDRNYGHFGAVIPALSPDGINYAYGRFPVVARLVYGPKLNECEFRHIEDIVAIESYKLQQLRDLRGTPERGNAARYTREMLWEVCALILLAKDLPPTTAVGNGLIFEAPDKSFVRRQFPVIGRGLYGPEFSDGELERIRRVLTVAVHKSRRLDRLVPFLGGEERFAVTRSMLRRSLWWSAAALLEA